MINLGFHYQPNELKRLLHQTGWLESHAASSFHRDLEGHSVRYYVRSRYVVFQGEKESQHYIDIKKIKNYCDAYHTEKSLDRIIVSFLIEDSKVRKSN